jgi:hypothetical protein
VIDLSRRTPLRNGDVIVMCTDGLWSRVRPARDRGLAHFDADPHDVAANDARRREARRSRRRQPVGDHRTLGAGNAPDEQTTTITETLGIGDFETQIDRTLTLTDRKGSQRDLTDDEIEHAIEEIQSTIQKYRR